MTTTRELIRPVIGLSGHRDQAAWAHWDTSTDLLHATYVDSVISAGGQPVILPTANGVTPDVVSRLDGLIITGGPDVSPALYGHEPHLETAATHPERDRNELAMLERALDLKIPVLAICRGAQLLNVWAGGTLEQHLPGDPARLDHGAGGVFAERQIRVLPDTWMHAAVGASTESSCHHHQAVDRLGAGLVATAFAEDGTVEAFERPGASIAIAVEWHPEETGGGPIFAAFVAAAANRRHPLDGSRI